MLGMACNPRAAVLATLALLAGAWGAVVAQRTDAFVVSRDHAAIQYASAPVTDRVSELNRKLTEGSVRLTHNGPTGYLKSALEALNVPPESQVAVFGQNSFQSELITMKNPRTLFFNDTVAVGYIRGASEIEVAAHDARQGVVFYTLNQRASDAPQFTRNNNCLACHLSWTTLGVPGWFVISMQTLPEDKNAYASGFASDHRSSFDSRWGGWYLTGSLGGIRHIGNRPISTASSPDAVKAEARELQTLESQVDVAGYLTPHSDVVALMTLEHQTHMVNLITRMGWETRLAAAEGRPANYPRLQEAAADLVDYLLFVYEVPLPGKIRGSSGFAATFAARGPVDGKGRSLRQFDLEHRLMRYPCSYLIYSEAFDALPDTAKTLVYKRLWQVLSGQDTNARYARLAAADRQAIREILKETKKDLPAYFQ
jgi:hypothetical protein